MRLTHVGRWLRRRIHWYLSNPIENFYYDLKHHWQRSRKGWSDQDTIDIASYLAQIIPEMLIDMRDYSHSYPSVLVDPSGKMLYNTFPEGWREEIAPDVITDEDAAVKIWNRTLTDIADAFREWSALRDGGDIEAFFEKEDQLKVRMMGLIHYFGNLWD